MVLFGLVSAIARFVKVRLPEENEVIDTAVFRLHYRVTSAVLFLACILCTATSLLGEPISCMADYKENKMEKPLNTYCWISSTFTLPHLMDLSSEHAPYPGIGPHDQDDKQTYHTYYQWVPFTLLFQGILFYLPHWLWKNMEQKRIYAISKGLRGVKLDISSSHGSVVQLADYLYDTMHCNFLYGFGYIFCEILNLVNVIGNIFLINKFLGNVFWTYGTEVISFMNRDQSHRTDPMIKIFPRITKCTFHSYGSSGTIQKHDLMCVMAINVINEKIYIFLWFWLIMLCVLSAIGLVYTVLLAISKEWRVFVLRKRFLCRPQAEFLARHLSFGDFMLLNFLSYNVHSSLFDIVLQRMCARLNYCKAACD